VLAAVLLACGLASATTPEEWAGLYNGRLAAAMDHDPTQAVAIYEAILSNLSATDPLRGELLYWLGRAHYAAQEMDAARAALLGAAATPRGATNPGEMADALRTWSSRVRSLPSTVKPDARITGAGAWHLAFDELDEPVEAISIRLRAYGGAAIVRVELTTLDGRNLPTLEAVELPSGDWIDLTLEMSDFRSVQSIPDGQQLWLLSVSQHESVRADVVVRVGEVQIR